MSSTEIPANQGYTTEGQKSCLDPNRDDELKKEKDEGSESPSTRQIICIILNLHYGHLKRASELISASCSRLQLR